MSFATVAIETFITDVSNVIRNCADARVSRIVPALEAEPLAEGVSTAPCGSRQALQGARPQPHKHLARIAPTHQSDCRVAIR
ncbi:hypothetical protein ACWDWO_14080 [Actinopolymorpha singaporensis]